MYEHDVLVIGAGLAGMRAAYTASQNGVDVAVVTKVYPVRSHSNAAQGGINAAMTDRGDAWEDHAFETVKGSDYLADQDAVEILSSEAEHEVISMEHMGVIFSRDDEGRLATRAFGGQSQARTFFVADFTGQVLLHVLHEQILRLGVRVYEEWFVLSLIMEEGVCVGAVVMEMKTGDIHVIRAKAVIIAAGGLGRAFEPSTNALICTGDGMALAYQVGAPLMDMEMVQYHPTTLKSNGALLSEAARGEGAYLLNSEGQRFMERYAPNMMELASRDVVSRAEQTEINEGRGVDGCVLLDVRHLGEKVIDEKLSQIRQLGIDFAGADMAHEPVPIRPGMHYQMGGIKTDVDGLTNVPGLYAAGETACVSVHGGNRLGANSLLDTLVFGRRSGEHATDYVRSKKHANIGDGAADADKAQIRDDSRPRWRRRALRCRPPRAWRDHEHPLGRLPRRGRDARGLREAQRAARPLRQGSRPRQGQGFQHKPHLHAWNWASCSTARRPSSSARWSERKAGARTPAPTCPTATTRTGSSTS